ncbi:MAG: tRNA (N6-isopentenyl adenosine(37)-C2)-methylthiotransferase MiaB [Deltaproteobacteria bacterium]|nr:tRNA (N6-isopentenyl adenosine(37)-C2)-methylthiotransferase MiaB [Deltaproteobacteria bacterium]
MNEQDSQVMKGLLVGAGFSLTRKSEEADLILINTCSVREKAYHKAMSEIGRHTRKEKKKVLLGVAGCVVSQEGEEILRKKPMVDFVLGTDHIDKLPLAIDQVREQKRRVSFLDFSDLSDYEFPVPMEVPGERKAKSYVTIMKGCDNSCSFCIVPMTRGTEVSRPPDAVLKEIRLLVGQGVKEVMLLGQNVNSYGKGLAEGVDFPKLLRRIAAETGIRRVRFTSPHPKDLSMELIREYAENESLCPHIHLPVQSGSDRILKKMRRATSRRVYLRKVNELKKLKPDIAITTDIIVGFPGETEADFCDTLSLIEEVCFDQSYSFIFSSRPETAAALMTDDTVLEVKQERFRRLQVVQKNISLRRNRERIGLVEEVLVEGPSLEGGGQLSGRTPHGRIVNFDGAASSVGDILGVTIRDVSAFSLRGRRVA